MMDDASTRASTAASQRRFPIRPSQRHQLCTRVKFWRTALINVDMRLGMVNRTKGVVLSRTEPKHWLQSRLLLENRNGSLK